MVASMTHASECGVVNFELIATGLQPRPPLRNTPSRKARPPSRCPWDCRCGPLATHSAGRADSGSSISEPGSRPENSPPEVEYALRQVLLKNGITLGAVLRALGVWVTPLARTL